MNVSFKHHVTCAVGCLLLATACSTNPNKPVEQDTRLKGQQDVGGGVSVGQNSKGEVVTTRKQKLADQLNNLQHDVYQLESDIYGQEDYGRKGLYGVLQECLDKGGELKRLPTKAILTRDEDKYDGKLVMDENKQLVEVSDEFYLDRIKRFQGYKDRYLEQKDDFTEKVRICQASGNKPASTDDTTTNAESTGAEPAKPTTKEPWGQT